MKTSIYHETRREVEDNELRILCTYSVAVKTYGCSLCGSYGAEGVENHDITLHENYNMSIRGTTIENKAHFLKVMQSIDDVFEGMFPQCSYLQCPPKTKLSARILHGRWIRDGLFNTSDMSNDQIWSLINVTKMRMTKRMCRKNKGDEG